jgi:hypothetical protein
MQSKIVLTYNPIVPSPAFDLISTARYLQSTNNVSWLLVGDNYFVNETLPQNGAGNCLALEQTDLIGELAF